MMAWFTLQEEISSVAFMAKGKADHFVEWMVVDGILGFTYILVLNECLSKIWGEGSVHLLRTQQTFFHKFGFFFEILRRDYAYKLGID